MTSGQEIRHYVRSALGRRRFNLLIFFVTSRCNAKCDFCFYWDHLNHQGDLTLDEIRKISATMPPFHRLLFSGGETFMRKELVDIVQPLPPPQWRGDDQSPDQRHTTTADRGKNRGYPG